MDGTAAAASWLCCLFTDIEGSTRLQQSLGAGWLPVLAEHDRLLLGAVEACGGRVETRMGDGLFAVFDDVTDGLRCAIRMQHELHAHPWPAGNEVRVRIGAHVGETARTVTGELTGLAINQAARIMAAAHGGQVLVSEDAHRSEADTFDFQALGRFRLKDFDVPIALYQLLDGAMQSAFPQPRVAPVEAHNLPLILTSFIGRRPELRRVEDLFRHHRLVTIAGPGGVGKTRLTVEFARQVAPRLQHGVWFVPLASIDRSDLVADAVNTVLNGDRGIPGDSGDGLRNRLVDKSALLILDNCEQVVDAVGDLVADLLAHCPQLLIATTSREPLHVGGEFVFRLDPLAAAAGSDDAVRLFADRAWVARPGVDLSDAGALAEICQRLDGVPLAIELAASRVRSLSVRDLCRRLTASVRPLTSKDLTKPAHQQTIDATLRWSYDLLSGDEQQVLRRLSIFPSTFDLAAAESVCVEESLEPDDVLDLLTDLVDKSLVLIADEDDSVGYRLLTVVRDFAHHRLVEAGEDDAIRRRHLAWVRSLMSAVPMSYDDPAPAEGWIPLVTRHLQDVRVGLTTGFAAGEEQAVVDLLARLTNWSSETVRWKEMSGYVEDVLDRGWTHPERAFAWILMRAQKAPDLDIDAVIAAAQRAVEFCRQHQLDDELVWAELLYGERALLTDRWRDEGFRYLDGLLRRPLSPIAELIVRRRMHNSGYADDAPERPVNEDRIQALVTLLDLPMESAITDAFLGMRAEHDGDLTRALHLHLNALELGLGTPFESRVLAIVLPSLFEILLDTSHPADALRIRGFITTYCESQLGMAVQQVYNDHFDELPEALLRALPDAKVRQQLTDQGRALTAGAVLALCRGLPATATPHPSSFASTDAT